MAAAVAGADPGHADQPPDAVPGHRRQQELRAPREQVDRAPRGPDAGGPDHRVLAGNRAFDVVRVTGIAGLTTGSRILPVRVLGTCGAGTFDDVLALSKAPVFASHSSARALSRVPRNMNDRMIRDLAAHDGVMDVNYHMTFLSQPHATALKADDARIEKAIDAESAERCGEDEACLVLAGGELTRERVAAGRLPRVEWTAIVDHIAHAAKVGGAAHVGLGSDFDGANMPYGMEDVSSLPKLTTALLERGYSPDDVRGILGGNILRLMDKVEAAAEHR
jgi:hypothetical protein